MQVNEDVNLSPYTTFYIGGPSRYLIFAQDSEEVAEALVFANDKQLPLFIMGGGSNVLVSDQGFAGVAVRIESVGIDLVEESAEHVLLKVASGEVWDDVVRLAVEEGWWGIENLSHIPGFSGAFAVQNVGAYGQEASQVVIEVEVLDRENSTVKTLPSNDLKFGYRRSIFNSEAKGRYIILSTTLKLSKTPQPNLSYGDLAERFAGKTPDIFGIREAIIEIRNKKFPFPNEPTKGNSGSFFRGGILSEDEFIELKSQLRDRYGEEALAKLERMGSRLKVAQGYKTPTAFLIELAVGKDLEVGGAKLNPDQPAIILNHTGKATSQDVINLFKLVQEKVKTQTGVTLEAEPEFIGFPESEISGMKLPLKMI